MKNSRDFLQYLSDKLDVLDTRLDHINETLVVQQEQLKEHMRRSELNERAIEVLRDELKPVFADRLRFLFLGKLLGFLAASVSVVYYLVKIWKGG